MLRLTINISELTSNQWEQGEFDHLSPAIREELETVREQLQAIDEYYTKWYRNDDDEIEYVFDKVGDHCPVRAEKNSLIGEYLAGGLRLPPMLSRDTTTLRHQAVGRNIDSDWRGKKRDEYYAEHGNETRILIVRPEEVDDLITCETNRDYFRDEIWIDTLDVDPIPYLILDIEELKNLREEIEDSAKEEFGCGAFDCEARYPTIWNSGNGVEEEDEDEGIVPNYLASLFAPRED